MSAGHPPTKEKWIDFVARAMREESLGYRVDEAGGVHFAIDEQFERNRAAILAGLGGSRYQTAKTAFEEAHRDLDAMPPDTRGAVRANFDAVENVFRLFCPRAPRLGAAEIAQYLAPGVEAAHSSDVTAKRSLKKILDSFGEWVDAVHFYRHAPGTEEPAPPPLEIAVLMISQGSAFLRWLVELDRAANSPSKP